MAGAPQTQTSTHYDDSNGSVSETLHGILRFLRILRFRKKTVGWSVAICLILAGGYFCVATRYYESIAQLMISKQNADNLSTVGESTSQDNTMANHQKLVISRRVVQQAIERLAPEHRVDLMELPPHEWAPDLMERLHVIAGRKDNYLTVSYQSRAPESAAAVVHAVINSYLDVVEEIHRGTAQDVTDVLLKGREEDEKLLATLQRQLQDLRKRIGHLAVDPEAGVVDPTISRAIHLNESLIQAQQRRVELQASLESVRTAIRNGEDLRRHVALVEEAVGQQMLLSALGLGAKDLELLGEQQQQMLRDQTELRRLSPFYGPNHPSIVALTDQITATQQYLTSYHASAGNRFESMSTAELGPMLVQMLQQSVAQAFERERQLSASFEQARMTAVRQSGELMQVENLEGEIARVEARLDGLNKKLDAVNVHQLQSPIQASITREPLPNAHPVSPKFHVIFTAALMAGVALGSGIVYVQDLLDDRFNSPEEMALQLGLPVLSIVRKLKAYEGEGLKAVQMFVDSDAVDTEAFRTLRTTLTLQGESTDRLVVSSAEPSDGKTTIASNLAVSFAQIGKRTLVIDADLRKPGMTALMGLKGQPGTTDLLTCDGDLGALAERCLVGTELDNLDVIPAGPRRPDAAELLSGSVFSDLLAWADAQYDKVVIDCPPVLAVSDAQIVGRLVDGVVVVVTPEKNHRRLVTRACESFLGAGAHVLGVVANRVSQQSEGYGYGYGYGYGHTEEDKSDDKDEEEVLAVTPGPAWGRLVGDGDTKNHAA